jgi:hypothetical protein
MEKSYFAEYVKKWFKILSLGIVEKLNDSNNQVTYLFKTMLNTVVSVDGRWDSMAVSKSIVAADIVDIDSPVPIKKRDSIRRAGGEIPTLGMGMSKTAKLIQNIKNLENQGTLETQIVKLIFDDLGRVITGIYERLEWMFLQGLSTGVILVQDAENTGVGIRLDFGYKDENRYGVAKKWGNQGYTPLSDIERVLSSARDNGDNITVIALDKAAYNQIRKSDEAKSLYAGSIGNFTGNSLVIPTPAQFDALIADEYKVKFLVIDRTIRVEKDGKQKPVRPFAENTLVFLTAEQVGSLVYGILAEQDSAYRVKNVEYQIVDSYMLVSKYSETNPLREFTNVRAMVLPVINNVDSIYILNTQEIKLLTVDPAALSFTKSANNAGKTITAEATGPLTAESDSEWATVTVSGNVATVTVAANSTESAPERTAYITLSADYKQVVVPVTQAGA